MNPTQQAILKVVKAQPLLTMKQIAYRVPCSYGVVRTYFTQLPLSRMVIRRHKKGKIQPGLYELVRGVEFCPICGRVIE